jgi:hypothetical protein
MIRTVIVATRVWASAIVYRVLKRVLPLETLVRLAHRAPRPRRSDASTTESDLHAFLARAGRFPFRAPGNCLERSLAVYTLLCESGSAPRLIVGVRRGGSQSIDGHVWVVAGDRAVGESDRFIAEFAPVTEFDASGRRTATARARAIDDLRFV